MLARCDTPSAVRLAQAAWPKPIQEGIAPAPPLLTRAADPGFEPSAPVHINLCGGELSRPVRYDTSGEDGKIGESAVFGDQLQRDGPLDR
jgi:hypothetical protein